LNCLTQKRDQNVTQMKETGGTYMYMLIRMPSPANEHPQNEPVNLQLFADHQTVHLIWHIYETMLCGQKRKKLQWREPKFHNIIKRLLSLSFSEQLPQEGLDGFQKIFKDIFQRFKDRFTKCKTHLCTLSELF